MRFLARHWLLCTGLALLLGNGKTIAQSPPALPTDDARPPELKVLPIKADSTAPRPADTKPAAPAGKEKQAALIIVHVPENAVIWFGDQKMTQTGVKRTFQSPPLEPGKSYFYTMKIARPNPTAGQPDVVSEHEVGVTPGQTTEINFLKPGEGTVIVPGQIYTPPRRILPPLFRPSEGSGYR
jgi:uncharacterized protein (TIGR03000 family)